MDNLADNGSHWFCTAAHVVGTASFEMQACGDHSVRYWVGVTTTISLAILAIIALWRVGERRII